MGDLEIEGRLLENCVSRDELFEKFTDFAARNLTNPNL